MWEPDKRFTESDNSWFIETYYGAVLRLIANSIEKIFREVLGPTGFLLSLVCSLSMKYICVRPAPNTDITIIR
jgi:hypothetical protein